MSFSVFYFHRHTVRPRNTATVPVCPAQSDSDVFKYKRAVFYSSINSKAGLAFAKAATMRVTMHIDKSSAVVAEQKVLENARGSKRSGTFSFVSMGNSAHQIHTDKYYAFCQLRQIQFPLSTHRC